MLTLTGEIRDMTIPWLFQDLDAAKKSGTAVFEQDKAVKKVYFGSGDILFASSNKDEDRLGEFLLSKGRINQSQFETASAMIKTTNKKLGAVLFELGLLSPKDLVAEVKLQIKHIIMSLFTWRSGNYRFEEGAMNSDEIIPLKIGTAALILEGIQALDWQIVRKSRPPMNSILRLPAASSPIIQKSELTADQNMVLSLIDGCRTVDEICAQAGMGDFNALKAVYLLLALKMAEVGGVKSEKQKPREPHASHQAAKTAQKQALQQSEEELSTRTAILQAFDNMKNKDDFQVLGVNNTMSPEELKKVYFKLAKRYHPDRHLEPEMADVKEKLEALFARVHDAYQRVSTSEQHQQFEEKHAEEYVENYVEKTGRALSYFNAGIKDFKVGNFWGAAESFAWSVRLDPVKAPYFYYYALSLARIPRRAREAEENLQKAIEIDPLKPEYHLELGKLYLKTGLKTKALDVLNIGLRDNPYSEKIREAIRAAGGEAPEADDADTSGLLNRIFKNDE